VAIRVHHVRMGQRDLKAEIFILVTFAVDSAALLCLFDTVYPGTIPLLSLISSVDANFLCFVQLSTLVAALAQMFYAHYIVKVDRSAGKGLLIGLTAGLSLASSLARTIFESTSVT
ncbi:unnamed protein product, partial [Mycena citricolor]